MTKEICPNCGQVIRKKHFVPPTLDEVKAFQLENPELLCVNAELFWKGFNDGGWYDTQGKPVRNWKLKMRTWASHSTGKVYSPPKPKIVCKCGCGRPYIGSIGNIFYASPECRKKLFGY